VTADLLNAPFDWSVFTPVYHVLRLVHSVVVGISSLEVCDDDASVDDIICHMRRSEVLSIGLLSNVLTVRRNPIVTLLLHYDPRESYFASYQRRP
jgi:hypothetical protein